MKLQQIGNMISIRPMTQMSHHHQPVPQTYSRSSQSTPSPSTTTANLTSESNENGRFNPIVKMEVPDDEGEDVNINCMEQKSCDNGNFNYVGDFIAAELNKLPLRDAFILKNILIREVLNFGDRLVISAGSEKPWKFLGSKTSISNEGQKLNFHFNEFSIVKT